MILGRGRGVIGARVDLDLDLAVAVAYRPQGIESTPPLFSTKASTLPQLHLSEGKCDTAYLLTMEPRRAPEYIIEVFADPSSVRDVVKGNCALRLRVSRRIGTPC
jgi:hypothetical protein